MEPDDTLVGGDGTYTVPVEAGGVVKTGGLGVSTHVHDERTRRAAMRLYLMIIVEN